MWGCGLDLSGSEQSSVTGSCEHGNKLRSSIQHGSPQNNWVTLGFLRRIPFLGNSLTLSSTLRLDFQNGLFPSGFETTIFYVSHTSHACYMPRAPHPLWFDHLNSISSRARTVILFTVQFSPSTCLRSISTFCFPVWTYSKVRRWHYDD